MYSRKYLTLVTILLLLGAILLGVHVYRQYTHRYFFTFSVLPKGLLHFDIDSDIGYYDIPPNSEFSVQAPWADKPVINHINDAGMNSDVHFALTKGPRTFRFITLGDSHTFGLYVPTSQNFSSLLEKMLSDRCAGKTVEAMNLGVPGYDIRQAEEHLKRVGLQYDPDLVIWFLKDDDFTKLPLTGLSSFVADKSKQIDFGASGWDELEKKLAVYVGAENVGPMAYDLEDAALHSIDQLYHKKLLIFSNDTLTPEEIASIQTLVKERPDTYFLNVKLASSELYFPDFHPTLAGHQFIAEHIYDYMVKNKITPCS